MFDVQLLSKRDCVDCIIFKHIQFMNSKLYCEQVLMKLRIKMKFINRTSVIWFKTFTLNYFLEYFLMRDSDHIACSGMKHIWNSINSRLTQLEQINQTDSKFNMECLYARKSTRTLTHPRTAWYSKLASTCLFMWDMRRVNETICF